MDNPEVVFLSAPYTFPLRVSLALSMFQARLTQDGVSSYVYYPMFAMMRHMGRALTARFARLRSLTLFEEFIFAHLTGMEENGTPEEFAAVSAERDPTIDPETFARMLRRARQAADKCTEEAARRIVSLHPRVLAASSLFMQNNASLAILKRVRELEPGIRTMMGGVNCSGEAGAAILRFYPQVDAIFFGEGDMGITRACRALMTGEKALRPEGLVMRGDAIPRPLPHPMTHNMNDAPIPDFSDFLRQMREECPADMLTEILDDEQGLILLAEGSRGCWWGEKQACSFCGLNGEKNIYRAKTPERLFEEIRQLSARYDASTVELTDNVLSRETVRGLPPLLKTLERELFLIAEVRTSLTERELRELRGAGFRMMQAGVETIQDHLLALMGKGGSAVGNVAFMKYCMRSDVQLMWNLLYAVPGERAEDYDQLTELIPKLTHFRPPQNMSRILFQKYSRYLSAPDSFGLVLKAGALYPFLYGDRPELIEALAFFYDLVGGETAALFEAHKPLYRKMKEAGGAWQSLWMEGRPPRLTICDRGAYTVITDTRPCRKSALSFLQGAEAELCSICDAPVSLKTIMEKTGGRYPEQRVREAIDWLLERSFLICPSGRYLCLALPQAADET